jgi:hypothetical protein
MVPALQRLADSAAASGRWENNRVAGGMYIDGKFVFE